MKKIALLSLSLIAHQCFVGQVIDSKKPLNFSKTVFTLTDIEITKAENKLLSSIFGINQKNGNPGINWHWINSKKIDQFPQLTPNTRNLKLEERSNETEILSYLISDLYNIHNDSDSGMFEKVMNSSTIVLINVKSNQTSEISRDLVSDLKAGLKVSNPNYNLNPELELGLSREIGKALQNHFQADLYYVTLQNLTVIDLDEGVHFNSDGKACGASGIVQGPTSFRSSKANSKDFEALVSAVLQDFKTDQKIDLNVQNVSASWTKTVERNYSHKISVESKEWLFHPLWWKII